jgi:hypothetical protein
MIMAVDFASLMTELLRRVQPLIEEKLIKYSLLIVMFIKEMERRHSRLPNIIRCSIHCTQNFPSTKQLSDDDIALDKGCSDKRYL